MGQGELEQLTSNGSEQVMNCYDCDPGEQAGPAIGVCHECGAGLCREHVRVTQDVVHGNASPGLVTRPRNARVLACTMCHEAGVTE